MGLQCTDEAFDVDITPSWKPNHFYLSFGQKTTFDSMDEPP